jgi:hypothetical protein
MLAYYMLYTNKDGMTADALDRAVEQWLSRYGGRLVDFEIADALRKLHELGLVTEEEGVLKALPLDEALENLKAVAGESLFAMAESAA